VTVDSALHRTKHSAPIVSTEEGTHITRSTEQPEKALWSIRESREPLSNVTADRRAHSSKHCTPSVSTEAAMQIEERAEQLANAESPTDERTEPFSKDTFDTQEHAKQPGSIVTTARGIVMLS
jgi:hypothetical protein